MFCRRRKKNVKSRRKAEEDGITVYPHLDLASSVYVTVRLLTPLLQLPLLPGPAAPSKPIYQTTSRVHYARPILSTFYRANNVGITTRRNGYQEACVTS